MLGVIYTKLVQFELNTNAPKCMACVVYALFMSLKAVNLGLLVYSLR